jgi:TPR repeat protein
MYNLGRCLFYGIGVNKNRQAGIQWLRKAANVNDKNAQMFLEKNNINW